MKKSVWVFMVFFAVVSFLWTGSEKPGDKIRLGMDFLGYYTDNIFVNSSSEQDWVSQFHSSIAYPGKQLNLYLDASAALHTENPGFNWWLLEPGLEWFFPLKKRNAAYLEAGFAVLRYNDLYTDFNYTGPRFGAGIKLYPDQSSLLKVEYLFEARNYGNFDSFDFVNHTVFAEYSRTLPKHITLYLHTGFNYRYYLHIVNDYEFGRGYNYYDRYRQQGSGAHMGQGAGMGPRAGSSTFALGVPNLRGLIRVKKDLGARLALSGELEARRNFKGLEKALTLIRNAYILYPLNDDNLWDGVRFGFIARWLPWNGFSLEGNVGYVDKGYRGIFAMDADGNVIQPAVEREDQLLFCNVTAAYDIGKWEVFASWSFRDNDSSDDYFTYSMMTVSIGIGYYFN